MQILKRFKNRFLAETWAMPIDIFRILAGLLSLYYYITLVFEVEDFSNPDGLLNHQLFLDNFWVLRINLLQPSFASTELFYYLTGLGCLASIAITIGYRPRLLAGVLFVLTASIQRWNFGVMFVDDAIMHLLLFWLMLLPTGSTLTLFTWIKKGNSSFSDWLEAKVPGAPVRCFLANVFWIYFFAGVTKLMSPFWREGFALYPLLLLPISRMPDFWQPEYIPALKIATYASIVMEITIPFLLFTPKRSVTKFLGLFFLLLFNLGIIITLKIPFANIALIASSVLFFREEIMEAIFKRRKIKPITLSTRKFSLASILALIFAISVIVSTSRCVPIINNVSWRVTEALWVIGVAQNYYLFNWIDRLNYHVDTEVTFYPAVKPKAGSKALVKPIKIDSGEILPYTIRNTLLLMRYFDIRWMFSFYHDQLEIYKEDLNKRIAKKICGRIDGNGRFYIKRTMYHVTPENYDLREIYRIYKILISCSNKEVVFIKESIK
ncbi:MAG: hypothetical protein V3U58_00665 [Thermodesulfobacteriota bacterium]